MTARCSQLHTGASLAVAIGCARRTAPCRRGILFTHTAKVCAQSRRAVHITCSTACVGCRGKRGWWLAGAGGFSCSARRLLHHAEPLKLLTCNAASCHESLIACSKEHVERFPQRGFIQISEAERNQQRPLLGSVVLVFFIC